MEQQYGHPRNDRRSVQLHRAIAEKLVASPEIDLPVPILAERLTEFNEEMVALRQCTPFAGILTPQERWQNSGFTAILEWYNHAY